jgi:hypothetical protein
VHNVSLSSESTYSHTQSADACANLFRNVFSLITGEGEKENV